MVKIKHVAKKKCSRFIFRQLTTRNLQMGKADEDVVSKIEEHEIEALRSLAGLPASAVIIIPDEDERPQLCPEGFVIFYEYPFKTGFKFPFSPLVRQILEMYDISPGQLMPLVWRVCHVLETVTADWTDRLTLGDLCKCYEFRKKEMSRVTIYRRPGFAHLVEGADTVNDRGWNSRYFFVDKESLGVPGKYLKDGWRTTGLRLDSISAEDGSDKAIKKLLQVSVSARMFCKPIILTPSASSSRTSEMKGKMSREEILARAKRKRDSSEVPSGSTFSTPYVKVAAKEADKQQPDPTVTAGVSARLRARNPVVDVVDTYDLSLPPDFLVIEGLANGIWPDAEKLLFPAAKERLDSLDTEALNAQTVQLSLQCVQNGLSLRLRLSQLAKENASLNEKVKRLQEQFLKAKQAKEQAERSWKESEAAREEMEARLQQVEVEWQQKEAGLAEVTDRLSSQVAGLQEELKDQEAEIIMRVRASMANKFLLGKTDTKYLQSVVDDYLRFGSIKDLESEGKRRKGRRKT